MLYWALRIRSGNMISILCSEDVYLLSFIFCYYHKFFIPAINLISSNAHFFFFSHCNFFLIFCCLVDSTPSLLCQKPVVCHPPWESHMARVGPAPPDLIVSLFQHLSHCPLVSALCFLLGCEFLEGRNYVFYLHNPLPGPQHPLCKC